MKNPKYEERLTIKVPRGTMAALQELADRKYLAPSTYARMEIMRVIEENRRRKEDKAA
jgi:hypothetical protein